MSTVREIEQAVQSLTPDRLAEFRAWFAEYDAGQWDSQIARDAAAGKLEALAEEAIGDFRSGQSRAL